MKKRHEQKLVILSVTAFLLLNIPLVFIFDGNESILGIPAFYASVFCIWLLVIIVSYVILKRHYE